MAVLAWWSLVYNKMTRVSKPSSARPGTRGLQGAQPGRLTWTLGGHTHTHRTPKTVSETSQSPSVFLAVASCAAEPELGGLVNSSGTPSASQTGKH